MAKYLDADGLQHYHESLQPSLVRGVTQAEYDALSEEEKRGLVVITDAQPSGGSGESGGTCEDVYSTEERRIGTWIDGKPLYRKTYSGTLPNAAGNVVAIPEYDVMVTINASVTFYSESIKTTLSFPFHATTGYGNMVAQGGYLVLQGTHTVMLGKQYYAALEYTKTTDQPEVTT